MLFNAEAKRLKAHGMASKRVKVVMLCIEQAGQHAHSKKQGHCGTKGQQCQWVS
jgi:hypothetical protein